MRGRNVKVRAGLLFLLLPFGLAILLLQPSLSGGPARAQSEQAQPDHAPLPPAPAIPAQSSESLRGGWTDFAPFQSATRGKLAEPQGLDVEVLEDILGEAKMEARLLKQSWADQLQSLMEGRSDFALGAFKPAEGDDRFYYSLPYRWARISLFVRAEDKDRYGGRDVAVLLARDPEFRIGVIPGRLFQDSALNRAIDGSARAGRLVYAQSNEDNLQNLVAGRIDGFVGDRLGVAASALNTGLMFGIAEIAIPGTSSVHVLLSKETVSAGTLARINSAISTLDAGGQLTRRLHNRISSVVMRYVLDSMPLFVLIVVGTVASAMSGVLIADRENFSFFGALVLAALPAVGGGVLRDLLLSRQGLGVVSTPLYLIIVGATVLAGFGIVVLLQVLGLSNRSQPEPARQRMVAALAHVQEICDAAGLAAFTASGLAVAVSVGAEPLWLWGPIAAMLSAAGGGILRDIVRQSGKVATLTSSLYAEIPLLWGFGFSVFLLTRPTVVTPEQIGAALVVTVLGTFLTRLSVVFLGVRAPPFRWQVK